MAPPRPPPGDQRLSMIAEDADHQPSTSRMTSSAASNNTATRGPPPRASAEAAPPGYRLWDVTGPKGEKLRDVRNNKYLARRGGWKRALLVLLVLFALAIGLGVGLGVGLAKRNNSTSSHSGSSPSGNSSTPGPFPQGSYQFLGDLVSTQTNCTENQATWQCWPYHTYSEDASQSGVTFDWVISNASSSGKPSQLLISSDSNPFAITFANTSLTLQDAGTANERYTFSIPLDKYVQPPMPLTASDGLDACWFNGTTLTAALYTKKPPASNLVNSTGMDAQATGWASWPGALEVNNTIAGGKGVPQCFQLQANGDQGAQITSGLNAQPASQTCGCFWRNFELS